MSLAVGSPLSENQLANEIGVSRTPIRDALKRLEREGLVTSVPRRGTFVSGLAMRDIVEIYEVRVGLEGFAARVASRNIPAARLRRLLVQVRRASSQASRGRLQAASKLDAEIHLLIIGATSNTRLIDVISTLTDQVHRIRSVALSAQQRAVAAMAEHRALLEAMIRKDEAGAEKAMRAHLVAARENAIHISIHARA